MVMGMQSYYRVATCICIDCNYLNRAVMTILTNRLINYRNTRLKKNGRKLSDVEKKWYGKSAMLRFDAATDEPIYPVGYISYKNPLGLSRKICSFTKDGRIGVHDNLRINIPLMLQMMRQFLHGRSIEYSDNRISLFSAQWGKCAVTGEYFSSLDEIHCHHKMPKNKGGTDKYSNLVLVKRKIHKLIHATDENLIENLLLQLDLDKKQLIKVNALRERLGNPNITKL